MHKSLPDASLIVPSLGFVPWSITPAEAAADASAPRGSFREVPGGRSRSPRRRESAGAARRPLTVSLDTAGESVHFKQDYFWVANHKVHLALIPLNGTNYWSANDSPGGLSWPWQARAEFVGRFVGRGARAPSRHSGTRMTQPPPGGHSAGTAPQTDPEPRVPPAPRHPLSVTAREQTALIRPSPLPIANNIIIVILSHLILSLNLFAFVFVLPCCNFRFN